MTESEKSTVVFDTIKAVLAVREYADKPIPSDALHRIVEAARYTASGLNKQPWHFIVIQNKATLKRLGEVTPNGPYIATSAAAIAVVLNPGRAVDGARAIQSIVIQAWAEGIGSNWVGVTNREETKALLGIPDELDIFAIIPLGFPAKPVGKGIKNRKPLGEVAFAETWNTPFE